MSQTPLTNSERIAGLGCLGYTEREADFLCQAALHSGYFLRRQYREFLGQEDGGMMNHLIEKVLARKHAQVFTYHYKTQIYHLGSRPFYAALGQPDNRNRRQHEPITIKSKLMTLDFVLTHRQNCYLATQQDKVDYFTKRRGIEPSSLPVKLYRSCENLPDTSRYFVENFPIFLPETPAPAGQDQAHRVAFCYIDEGAVTLAGFETFLARYRPLFACLGTFQVVYVAATGARFAKAETAFGRFADASGNELKGAAFDLNAQRLVEHFEARQRYETKQYALFDRARLIRLRDERAEFSRPEHEGLYRLWQSAGAEAVMAKLAPKQVQTGMISGAFSPCVLEQNYDFFGHINGL